MYNGYIGPKLGIHIVLALKILHYAQSLVCIQGNWVTVEVRRD